MSQIENPIRKRLHGLTFDYDTSLYPFKKVLEDLYGCELGGLHKHLGSYQLFDRQNDQSTLAHKVFYANYVSAIKPLYCRFINKFISPIVAVPFHYQVIPTFRIGLPGNRFVGEYHKDSKYNHLGYEVNFNLGLSGYTGEAALRVEKPAGSGDFVLLECPYGKVFSFDHIDCLHGSEPNPYDVTMVSFDFRLAVADLYRESDSASVNTGVEFRPGSYFSAEAA
jgi:hypothetical protein